MTVITMLSCLSFQLSVSFEWSSPILSTCTYEIHFRLNRVRPFYFQEFLFPVDNDDRQWTKRYYLPVYDESLFSPVRFNVSDLSPGLYLCLCLVCRTSCFTKRSKPNSKITNNSLYSPGYKSETRQCL